MKLWALAAFLLAAVTAPVLAVDADTTALQAACTAQSRDYVGEEHASRLPDFCGCLAGEISVYGQSAVDILTRDLKGEATDDDKAAYGDYETLEESARDAQNRCLRQNGLEHLADPVTEEEQGDIPFVTPDMTAFDATCRQSAPLLEILAEAPGDAVAGREITCTCLVREFPLNFQQQTVDIFAKDLAGIDAEEEKASYEDFRTFVDRADAIMSQCLAEAGFTGP